MSGQEARRRLSVYRQRPLEAREPFFEEAVAQAATEPALARWWAEQRALDEILARRLRRALCSLRGALRRLPAS